MIYITDDMDKKRVFKIDTNFGDYSVYEVFRRHGIAFVGCEDDNPRWREKMLSIREGDIVIISTGYAVVAVAEVTSPAADIHNFKLDYDPVLEKLDMEYGVPIMACRIDFYQLDESDYIWYEYRSRVCEVGSQEIQKAARELLNKYKKTGLGGIFSWATGELSQDAILCWLFDSIKKGNKYDVIAKELLYKMGISKSARISDMQVIRQCYHIDLILHFKVDGEDRVIIVEDKINASLYNNLQGYIKSVVENGLPDGFSPRQDQISVCVMRTGDGNEGERAQLEWNVVTRKDILDVLNKSKEVVRSSEILQGFYEKLQTWEQEYQGYMQPGLPNHLNRSLLAANPWTPWKGLYDRLCEDGIMDRWFYVSNRNGGFMCGLFPIAWDVYQGCTLYMQIESVTGRLCIKVGDVSENHASIRSEIATKFFTYAQGSTEFSNAFEPTKAQYGCYMTFAAIPREVWLHETLSETMEYLHRVQEWLNGFIRTINATAE